MAAIHATGPASHRQPDMGAFASLPDELVVLILAHVGGGKGALLSTSLHTPPSTTSMTITTSYTSDTLVLAVPLVCRAWRELCKHHIWISADLRWVAGTYLYIHMKYSRREQIGGVRTVVAVSVATAAAAAAATEQQSSSSSMRAAGLGGRVFLDMCSWT